METVKGLLRVLATLRRGKEGILGVNLLSLLGEAILLLPGLFLAYSDCYPHCNMISQDITKVPLNQGKAVCGETELGATHSLRSSSFTRTGRKILKQRRGQDSKYCVHK